MMMHDGGGGGGRDAADAADAGSSNVVAAAAVLIVGSRVNCDDADMEKEGLSGGGIGCTGQRMRCKKESSDFSSAMRLLAAAAGLKG